jgi:drug/metabolite transporter (DMT)-like permease
MKTLNFPIKLMIALLVIDVIVMVCYKYAELNTSSVEQFYWSLLFQPALWLGLLFSLLQLWTWTRILARTKLSLAYPVASLSYPLTMLAAQQIFSERLNPFVWIGGFLITVGVAMIGSCSEKPNAETMLP